jgi:hypothetical protein
MSNKIEKAWRNVIACHGKELDAKVVEEYNLAVAASVETKSVTGITITVCSNPHPVGPCNLCRGGLGIIWTENGDGWLPEYCTADTCPAQNTFVDGKPGVLSFEGCFWNCTLCDSCCWSSCRV